jgi:hypothetical protein
VFIPQRGRDEPARARSKERKTSRQLGVLGLLPLLTYRWFIFYRRQNRPEILKGRLRARGEGKQLARPGSGGEEELTRQWQVRRSPSPPTLDPPDPLGSPINSVRIPSLAVGDPIWLRALDSASDLGHGVGDD